MKIDFNHTIKLLQIYEKDFNNTENYLEKIGLLELIKHVYEESLADITQIESQTMYPLLMKENQI